MLENSGLQEDNEVRIKRIESEKFVFTETLVSHRTPVLFSTSQGLHLRKTKFWQPSSNADSHNNYDIQFCDLERWNTNRANTINLSEETSQNYTNVNERLRSVRFVMERGQTYKSKSN